jgi:hypothetical protein
MGVQVSRIRDFGGENLKERVHWGDSGEDERKIIRWVFKKKNVVVWAGLSWLRIGTGVGHL